MKLLLTKVRNRKKIIKDKSSSIL